MQALRRPGARRDDYAALNVKGKIVVLLAGAPSSLSTEERAHYGNISSKRELAAKRGAIGILLVDTPKGLVGADYFAQNPTLPKGNLVANVNLDMPVVTYDFKDVVAFGAARSSIGPAVARAAASMGIALVPDPEPEEGFFTRSDHYRFVQQGVPAVFLVTGPGGDGALANSAFRKAHYHQPSDDMNLPFKWAAATKFVALNLAVAQELADARERPRWNKGDFFGTLYNGHGATGK